MQFDDRFLQEMGLQAMPEGQKKSFLEYIQSELEIRIGIRISRGLTDAQLSEFDALTDQTAITRWLEKNRPDYRDVVSRTIEEMKSEIRANRDKLLA